MNDIRKDAVVRQPVVFNVPGAPVPKARPRLALNGHVYTPRRTQEYEDRIGWAWKETGAAPFAGPVAIAIAVYEEGSHPADWDNYAKVVCDALNTLAFEDDRQIQRATVTVVRGLTSIPGGLNVQISTYP